MNKSKIMNFADGPQEITVGMKVVYTNGQGGHHHRLHESTVEKVGNKLATLKNGDKFLLEDGSKQSQYFSGRLYSSRAAYDIALQESKVVSQVENLVRSFTTKMTYQQAIKIAEIMNLKLENV